MKMLRLFVETFVETYRMTAALREKHRKALQKELTQEYYKLLSKQLGRLGVELPPFEVVSGSMGEDLVQEVAQEIKLPEWHFQ